MKTLNSLLLTGATALALAACSPKPTDNVMDKIHSSTALVLKKPSMKTYTLSIDKGQKEALYRVRKDILCGHDMSQYSCAKSMYSLTRFGSGFPEYKGDPNIGTAAFDLLEGKGKGWELIFTTDSSGENKKNSIIFDPEKGVLVLKGFPDGMSFDQVRKIIHQAMVNKGGRTALSQSPTSEAILKSDYPSFQPVPLILNGGELLSKDDRMKALTIGQELFQKIVQKHRGNPVYSYPLAYSSFPREEIPVSQIQKEVHIEDFKFKVPITINNMNVVGFKARASENGELHLQIQGNPYAGFNTTLKSNGTLIIEVRSVSTASQNLPTNLMSVRSIISKSDSPLIENSGENALSHGEALDIIGRIVHAL